MNSSFNRLLQEATRLTREGDLSAATAAIQAALAPATSADTSTTGAAAMDNFAAKGRHDAQGLVIDVDARFVDDARSPANDDAPRTNDTGPAQASGEAGGAAAPTKATQEAAAPFAGTAAAPGGAAATNATFVPTPEAFVTGRHGVGAAARDYKLYIPPRTTDAPLPMVVMLHGCTQDPDDFAAGTGMNDAARAQGLYVLYPAQSAKANPQRCWNWFKHSHQARGRGEPAMLAGMVQEVMARHAVDPARVYVAGLSAGGAMAAIMGECYPELFAAVGVHSGLPPGAARDLPSALEAMKRGGSACGRRASRPTIVVHGDADPTVHHSNGDSVFSAGSGTPGPADAQTIREAGLHGYTRHIRRGADGRSDAEYWKVHGAGHAWSGGRKAGSYTDPKGPDATQAMLQFFSQHTTR